MGSSRKVGSNLTVFTVFNDFSTAVRSEERVYLVLVAGREKHAGLHPFDLLLRVVHFPDGCDWPGDYNCVGVLDITGFTDLQAELVLHVRVQHLLFALFVPGQVYSSFSPSTCFVLFAFVQEF